MAVVLKPVTVPQVGGAEVVNCALAYAPVAPVQLARTRQSYKVLTTSPLAVAEVAVVALAALVQVLEALVL